MSGASLQARVLEEARVLEGGSCPRRLVSLVSRGPLGHFSAPQHRQGQETAWCH